MTKEKILEFLNLNKSSKIDKFTMKLFWGFDVGFTFLIIIIGIVYKLFSLSVFSDLILMVFLVFSDIFFFVLCVFLKNPAHEFLYDSIISTSSTVKLFYSAILFSKTESTSIGLSNILILLIGVLLSLWIVREKRCILKELETNTIDQVRKKMQSKKSNKTIVPISATASITVIVFRLTKDSIDVSISFCMWCLACIWFYFAVLCVYNCIVAYKYKIHSCFGKD